MRVYVKDNKVLATHRDDQNLDDKYIYDNVYIVDASYLNHEIPFTDQVDVQKLDQYSSSKTLIDTDKQMIRAIDDLYAILLDKKIISASDLPAVIGSRIELRKLSRSKMG